MRVNQGGILGLELGKPLNSYRLANLKEDMVLGWKSK